MNILALKQDRFNQTYLQIIDVNMVGETGVEIAGCPHAAMVLILHARGQHYGVTRSCNVLIAPMDPAVMSSAKVE